MKKYETENRLAAIRENYLKLRDEHQSRFVTIDARKSTAEVHDQVVETISQKLV